MKIIGAKLQEFYSAWPMGKDWFHEDGDLETDDDGLILDPTAQYDIENAVGAVMWQGKGEEPKFVKINGKKIRNRDFLNIVAAYKAWAGSADTITLVIECPSESLNAVKVAVVAAGGRVL